MKHAITASHLSAAILIATALSAANAAAIEAPEQDREAILAMQGEYDVDFSFDETVILAPVTNASRPNAAAPARW